MKTIAMALAFLCMAIATQAAEMKWLDDFEKAKAQSASAKMPILMLLTGSDWCPGCMALEKEILSKPETQSFIIKNTVPMKVDFPRRHKLQPGVAAQNEKLGEKYNTSNTVPTLVLLDKDGKLIANVELRGEFSPKGFIAGLQEALAKAKTPKH